MAEKEPGRCAAITRQGDQCRNRAVVGEKYCAIHLKAAKPTPKSKPKPAAGAAKKRAAPKASAPTSEPSTGAVAAVVTGAGVERGQVENVAEELNKLAEEVRQKAPDYAAPPFSRSALIALLKSNAEQIAAYLPIDLARDIIRNLEGTTKEDLLDPDTWKGLWYILNYSLSAQAKGVLEEVAKRLSAIPGMDMVMQLTASVIESPRDLLSIDTWKGAAVILNAAVQAQVSALRKRVLGGDEE